MSKHVFRLFSKESTKVEKNNFLIKQNVISVHTIFMVKTFQWAQLDLR